MLSCGQGEGLQALHGGQGTDSSHLWVGRAVWGGSGLQGSEVPRLAATMEESRILFFPRDSFRRPCQKDALSGPEHACRPLAGFVVSPPDRGSLPQGGSAGLGAYLLYLSAQTVESEDLALDISKGQLASLLGTIPETLSRILGQNGKAGSDSIRGPQDPDYGLGRPCRILLRHAAASEGVFGAISSCS